MVDKIRVAIVGIGNCSSALIQGIEYYRGLGRKDHRGLMHYEIGGYKVSDIEVVSAFDIDERKVGKPLNEAIFSKPNCTKVFKPEIKNFPVKVQMGEVLDGVAEHMKDYPSEKRFIVAKNKPCNVEKVLKKTGTEILLNYLPVGSQKATEFYATACLNAGVAFINCVPVFIASNKGWETRFKNAGLPIIGDDVKSQLGATIVHRVLAKLFTDRGVKINSTYQLNVGGNTDFLNMLERGRLSSKKISKTNAVNSQINEPLPEGMIHIGPSDYIPWLNDNKVCFLRLDGRGFGDIPVNLELRLSVEDSTNSAGVVIDAIRCCKLALKRGISGVLISPSAYFMKHPPTQFPDDIARIMVEEFIAGKRKS